jgi:lysophospholipase L1-like esterase
VKRLLCLLSIIAAAAPMLRAADAPKVEFRNGDRIVFVGNEFFEREQDRCYIETELTTRFPDKNLTFRNLGYSGDTVRADARNLCAGWENFGPADQGFGRLKSIVEHIKPTLVFVAYGMNESFEGENGLPGFVQDLNHMLDMLSSGGARLVLVSPIRHEDLGRPLPDPTEHNKNLRLYIDAMEKLAQQRSCAFINLFEALGDGTKDSFHQPFTSDGIHLTPYGYWRTAMVMEQAMGYEPRKVQLANNASEAQSGRFSVAESMLPIAPPPEDAPQSLRTGEAFLPGQKHAIQISGLTPAGRFTLSSGTQPIATATGEQWNHGVQVLAGTDYQREEQLRKLIIAKNFDFFNFWRPDNDTYIFGYRKHEQGRNAVEIPRFEPLVEAKEAEIAKLRAPVPYGYVLQREGGK